MATKQDFGGDRAAKRRAKQVEEIDDCWLMIDADQDVDILVALAIRAAKSALELPSSDPGYARLLGIVEGLTNALRIFDEDAAVPGMTVMLLLGLVLDPAQEASIFAGTKKLLFAELYALVEASNNGEVSEDDDDEMVAVGNDGVELEGKQLLNTEFVRLTRRTHPERAEIDFIEISQRIPVAPGRVQVGLQESDAISSAIAILEELAPERLIKPAGLN